MINTKEIIGADSGAKVTLTLEYDLFTMSDRELRFLQHIVDGFKIISSNAPTEVEVIE
jgi:hypothetical protein